MRGARASEGCITTERLLRAKAVLAFTLWAALFTVIYTQSPLYRTTQNTYFLHGIAAAGTAPLKNDYLVSTTDPTPVFSFLVRLTAQYLRPEFFFVWSALLFGAYLAAAIGIAERLFQRDRKPALTLSFSTGFLAVHSIVLRGASQKLLGIDLPYLLHEGLAHQWTVSPKLAPCAFGVLFIAAVCFWMQDRPLPTALCTAAGATFHPTYVLTAAILTVAFMADLLRRPNGLRRSVGFGVGTFLLVLPIAAYVALHFRPAPEPLHSLAQRTLAERIIPHHTLLRTWDGGPTAIQLVTLAFGLFAARGTRLFLILAVSTGIALTLSVLALLTGSMTLALSFPWRISVVLVPLSTIAILAASIRYAARRWTVRLETHTKALQILCWLALAVMALGGAAKMLVERREIAAEWDRGVIAFARQARRAGEVYLVPVGSSLLTPTVMRDFRLNAGVPVFVDMQTHPYRDDELLEWLRRVRLAQDVYFGSAGASLKALKSAVEADGVTHVVWEATKRDLFPLPATELYRDQHFLVLKISSGSDSRGALRHDQPVRERSAL